MLPINCIKVIFCYLVIFIWNNFWHINTKKDNSCQFCYFPNDRIVSMIYVKGNSLC